MGVKFKVNEDFFKEWSVEMAYTLGFWYADGSVEFTPAIRGKYIRISCTDREIIESIKAFMESEHSIVEINREGNKTAYLLRIGNRFLFDQLIEHGVMERKSKIVTIPKIPNQYVSHFVRGYFDGDGCVYLEKSSTGNYKRMTTVFTSGSRKFLEQLQKLLAEVAGTPVSKKINTIQNDSSCAYQLRYSTRDSLRLYQLMYPSTIKQECYLQRKHDRFMEYMNERKLTVKDISSVVAQRGPLSL